MIYFLYFLLNQSLIIGRSKWSEFEAQENGRVRLVGDTNLFYHVSWSFLLLNTKSIGSFLSRISNYLPSKIIESRNICQLILEFPWYLSKRLHIIIHFFLIKGKRKCFQILKTFLTNDNMIELVTDWVVTLYLYF